MSKGWSTLELVIVLGAAVVILALPVVYLVLRYRSARRALELLHAERMAAIERGMDVRPLESADLGHALQGAPRTALLPGLTWLFVGLMILIARWGRDLVHPPLFVALIPLGVGLAYLSYHFIEERKATAEKSPP